MTKSQSRANGLSSFRHSDQTRSIMFDQLKTENESDFVRRAIVHLAEKNGFENKPTIRPDYIDTQKWSKIRQLDLKSFMQKNGKAVKARGERGVDYTYLYAYYFLCSLSEYKHAGSATLQRLAILDYGVKIITEKS